MKKLSSLMGLVFVFAHTLLSGVIIETAHFEELKQYVTSQSLIILDVDDTLLIPSQTLGTDVWYQERLQHYQKQDYSTALNKALAEWEAVRHLTAIKIAEEGTAEIIKELQDQNITPMGLSTQGLALSTRTALQLSSLDIDLSKTAPSPDDHYFINQHGVLYRHGLLSTSGTPKGPALLKLLDLLNYHPTHIVFINDKQSHLKDVESTVEAKGIEFIGLRYSYSDERIKNYRPEIANIQWNHSSFEHILSDDEAEQLLLGK